MHAATTKPGRRRKFLWIACAAAAIAVVCLLGGEAAVRVLRVQGDQLFVPNDRVGWVHRPSFRGLYVSPLARCRVSFNASGHPGPERVRPKPPGARRILLLGDSFTESLQVPYEETWACLLERELGSPWEVVNAGVSGYGTDNALLYLRDRGFAFDPDVVLVMFFSGNDVTDNAHDLYERFGDGLPKPYFSLDGGGLTLVPLPPSPPSPSLPVRIKNVLRDHSRLYLFLRDRTKRLRTALRQRQAAGGDVPAHWGVYRRDPPAEIERAWAITGALYETIARETTARGVRFAVGMMPTGWRIEEDEWKRLSATYPTLRDSLVWDFDRPERELAGELATLHVPALSLTADLRAARRTSPRPFYGDHLTPEGHAVVARSLARFLRDEVLSARAR